MASLLLRYIGCCQGPRAWRSNYSTQSHTQSCIAGLAMVKVFGFSTITRPYLVNFRVYRKYLTLNYILFFYSKLEKGGTREEDSFYVGNTLLKFRLNQSADC